MFSLTRHEDAQTQACNSVALLLASNTPLYPVYLWFLLGRAGGPWVLLTALSFPFFAATLFIARRHGLAARLWLCVCTSLNTAWVAWLLGPQSGVALFFLPCLVLAVLAFRETLPRILLTALPFALFTAFLFAPHGPVFCSPGAAASLLRLNSFSVAALCVVLPYLLGPAR